MFNLKYWILALRPKTLPASAAPVIVGSFLAFPEGDFNWIIFAITALCAILLQIIANFFNEVYDFKRGADTEDRLGPARMVASGLIHVQTMKRAAFVTGFITFLIGLFLVWSGGLPILIVGLASLLFAFLYTGGPYPLAYLGLGDIFVFIFFGLVAGSGSYFLQTHTMNWSALIASAAPGFLSMNILGVNNYRDADGDIKANKMTMAVRLGKSKSRVFFYINYVLAFIIPCVFAIQTKSLFNLLPLLSLPIALKLCKDLNHKTGKELNPVLAGAGKLVFIFSVLWGLGMVLGKLQLI